MESHSERSSASCISSLGHTYRRWRDLPSDQENSSNLVVTPCSYKVAVCGRYETVVSENPVSRERELITDDMPTNED